MYRPIFEVNNLSEDFQTGLPIYRLHGQSIHICKQLLTSLPLQIPLINFWCPANLFGSSTSNYK